MKHIISSYMNAENMLSKLREARLCSSRDQQKKKINHLTLNISINVDLFKLLILFMK